MDEGSIQQDRSQVWGARTVVDSVVGQNAAVSSLRTIITDRGEKKVG